MDLSSEEHRNETWSRLYSPAYRCVLCFSEFARCPSMYFESTLLFQRVAKLAIQSINLFSSETYFLRWIFQSKRQRAAIPAQRMCILYKRRATQTIWVKCYRFIVITDCYCFAQCVNCSKYLEDLVFGKWAKHQEQGKYFARDTYSFLHNFLKDWMLHSWMLHSWMLQ